MPLRAHRRTHGNQALGLGLRKPTKGVAAFGRIPRLRIVGGVVCAVRAELSRGQRSYSIRTALRLS